METNQIRYFLEVADLEHVTLASKRLNIAQPALSQSMHRLESELGVPLFRKCGRNLRLTEEGTYLRDRLKPLMDEFDDAIEGLKAIDGKVRQTVNVCIKSASVIAVEAMAQYSQHDPDANFVAGQDLSSPDNDIVIDSSVGSLMGVESCSMRSSVKSRLGKGGSIKSDPSSHSFLLSDDESFFEEGIGIVLPSKSGVESPIELDDLAEMRFICLAGTHRFRAICDKLCLQSGFAPQISFESDNPAVVRKMIGLGLGVGFWPYHSWGHLEGEDIELLPLKNHDFCRTVKISLTESGKEKDVAKKFYSFLTETFERCWEE